jgi:amino acid adenylation domain-containing protein
MDQPIGLSRRARLTPAQQALLEKRIRGEIPSKSSAAKIPRRSDQSIAPLSLAQEGQWLLQHLQPDNTVLNIFRAMRVALPVDHATLARALTEVARRHDVLRTNFRAINGVPMQIVRPPEPVIVGMLDLSTVPASEREAEFVRWSRKRTVEPFDLENGELFRVDLVRMAESDHIVFFNLHHIICDGWSLGVLVRETMVLYRAFNNDKPPPLPPLVVQYGDYATWQRSKLQVTAVQRQIAFWCERLADAPTSTDLPFDHPRPPDRSFRGKRRGVTLERQLVTKLRLLCQREQTTLFIVVMSALATLIHRHSGATDIIIGTPVANRGFREIEPLIGLFINTVVFRFDVSGDPTFRDFLTRVRSSATDVFDNQDVPFESVLNELGIRREKDRSPLFQVMLAMQPPRAASISSEIGLDPAVLTPRGSKFDMTLVLWESEDGDVGGIIEYATDLFEPDTIERLFTHFVTLLEGIAANPLQRVSALPILSEEEHRQAVTGWNTTSASYPQRCLHELFAEQAERTPQAVAVVFNNERLTYRDLDERANMLAWHLRSLGVGPDTIVGLCLNRSPALVIGLLGIVKAGGAYLPLDPNYPASRLGYICADAKPRLIVSEAALANGVVPQNVPVVRLDADWPRIRENPAKAAPNVTTPDHLAYVLYTSGSTGEPKGVMGTHRAVVNRLNWDVTTETSEEVYAQKTTPNFIDALWDIFMPLIRGQSTVIVPENVLRDPDKFIDLLAREGTTRIVLVPSLLRTVLDRLKYSAQQLPNLHHWACSGEALPASLVRDFHAYVPDAQLFNIYGTSEVWDATWFVTCRELNGARIPIGLPIANMRALVLDTNFEPVPPNVTGELFIGGVGLARGYLGRPALTAERFLPDPFGHGDRIYQTGDLARRRPDGVIEFVGRRDDQVKLRGHRIELSEIQAVVQSHPNVRNAVVVLRDDLPSGDPALVAYVVGSALPTVSALRAHVQDKLPSHMVPAHFVIMAELPLTPNGKLDRAKLPSPQPEQVTARKHVAPKSDTEKMLAGIWAQVLGSQTIGIDDNFFELGGDSLMLLRVQSAINERVHQDIPATVLFRFATIRALSGYLTDGQRSDLLVRSRSRGEARKKFLTRQAGGSQPPRPDQ